MLNNIFGLIAQKFGNLSILIGIVLLAVLGFLPTSTTWFVIKFIFAAFLLFLTYYYFYQENDEPESSDSGEFPELNEDSQDWLELDNDPDVEEIFENFLHNSLHLAKKVLVSDTVVLLLANYSKKQFQPRYMASDQQDQAINKTPFDIYKGLPSLILRNKKSLIENHLPQDSDILPYHQNNEHNVQSFAGVPVYYNDFVIGVLCADSKVKEAYGSEDLEILQSFAALVTAQLVNSNKLYEYETENWVSNILFESSCEMNRIRTEDELWDYLMGKIPGIVDCERISIAKKTENKQAEIIRLNGGTGNLKPGKTANLTEGLIGWVLRKNQSLLVEDFSSKENYVPRFSEQETPGKDYLSLICVPVSGDKNVVGAVCLESKRPRNFKEQHKRILQTITNQAATIFSRTQSLKQLARYNYLNPITEVENINAFNFIYPKEWMRANISQTPLSLLYFKIYFQIKEHGQDLDNLAVREFLQILLPYIADTDYIFHLSADTFVVLTDKKEEENIKRFLHEVLKKVSEKKIWAQGQVYDFYTSIGMVPFHHLSALGEEALEKGEYAAKQARLEGPNQFSILRETFDQIRSKQTDLREKTV
ncbi:MAG: GAF domain-containing protein [Calditrichia bacterium]